LARVEAVYQLLGQRECVSSHFFSGGHSFPADASTKAYEWLDRWLKP
jgi:hypothetical protein